MDRREYWDEEYTEYWKGVTEEAEVNDGNRSKVEKLSGSDFKAPNIAVITTFVKDGL